MKIKPKTKTNPAIIVRVVDGDTVEAVVDIGWQVSVKAIVRLSGIDCPEHNTPEGDAATKFTNDWIATEGSSVTLTSYSSKDRYGRHLATITSTSGKDLAVELLAAGHGKAWDGRGQRPKQ